MLRRIPSQSTICYFRKFVEETDPEVREKILSVVPDETRQALTAQWQKQKELISEAEGSQPQDLGSKGRPYTEDDLEDYQHARTKLELGDYLRSRQIARFFFTRKFALPDDPESEAYDPNIDYQDVKLKIVQQEGYDAHDFNLYDDRSTQLWRKPYIDGAVRELTAGDSRSQEQIRQAIEQLMFSSGTLNPDVRHTTRKAHRSRAIGPGLFPAPHIKNPPAHATGKDQPTGPASSDPKQQTGPHLARTSPYPEQHGLAESDRAPPSCLSLEAANRGTSLCFDLAPRSSSPPPS